MSAFQSSGTFAVTKSRPYWRLQDMNNPKDGVVDYVDIYFRKTAATATAPLRDAIRRTAREGSEADAAATAEAAAGLGFLIAEAAILAGGEERREVKDEIQWD